MKRYLVKEGARPAKPIPAGTIVYDYLLSDYGCANEDTRNTGEEHVSITYDEDGHGSFITIPRDDLEELP